ncbi:MAG: hypothetical protein OXI33_10380, partial [Chloroflexota bacterium]|nr:hypothetical protein [Chloroflexota bacterium]
SNSSTGETAGHHLSANALIPVRRQDGLGQRFPTISWTAAATGRWWRCTGVDGWLPVGHRHRRPAGSLPLHRPGAAVRHAPHADA